MRNHPFAVRGYLFAAAMAAAGSGCLDFDDDARPGDEITYQQGCFFGCSLDQPLLTGSHQRISVGDAADVSDVEVGSSDEDVAEFGLERTCYCERRDNGARIEVAEDARCGSAADKRCDNVVLVHAKGAGEAEFTLKRRERTLARSVVIVRDAQRARLMASYPDRLGSEAVTEIALGTAEQVGLELDLYDDEGRKLLASDGVSWSVDDPAVATLTAWLIGSGKQVEAGTSVLLQANAEGQARLTVAAPGLERSFDVTVGAGR